MARPRGCLLLLLPLLLLLLLLPASSHAKFYIGRYKTVPSIASVSGSQARSLPYIVYPGETGSESIAFNQDSHNRWRVELPPNRRLGHLEPATAFGLTNNYGNDPYKGYSLVHKHQVRYVIPPFTPGGRVHVAFQFWIPISLGGFFVSGRELEEALRSSNPTAYITSLFLKHLSANTTAGELLGHLEAPVVEAAIDRFLEWVVPHLHYFTGNSINTVNTYTPRPDKKRKHKTWKSKRSLNRLSGGKKRQETSPGLKPKEEEEVKNAVKTNTKTGKRKRSLNRLSDRKKRQETLPGLGLKEEEDKNAVKKTTTTWKSKRSLAELSGGKKRQETSPAIDSEEEDKNTVKRRSTGVKMMKLTVLRSHRSAQMRTRPKNQESLTRRYAEDATQRKKSMDGDTDIKRLKNTNFKSHRERMIEKRSLDGATEAKHSISTSTKTRRRRLAEARELDGATDLAGEKEAEPVQDARNTNSKSRRKRGAKESSLDEATGLAGEQKEEPVQDARSSWSPRVRLRRHKRQVRGASDGWVTIGGGRGGGAGDDYTNTSPLLTRPSAWSAHRPSQQVPNDRLMWDDDHHVITHNDLSMEQDKRPGVDLTAPIDYPASRPRPASSPSSSSSSSSPSWPSFLTRPTSRPAPSSYNPSHASNSQLGDNRPSFPSPPSPSSSSSSPSVVKPQHPFHLTSFDDLPSGATSNPQVLDVRSRLSRLDYLFTNLHLEHEDCRRRILCEVSREPDTFAPLSDMVHGETRLPGNPLDVSRELLNTAEGARLLSYVEAVKVGEDRSQVCDIYRYRCRVEARQVINTDILPIWREVVRWLTVKVLTQDSSKLSLASG